MIEPYSEIAIHSEKKGYYMNHTLTKEYLLLFNALTDTEETLRQLREDLIAVQRQAEELFSQLVEQMAEREGVTEQLKAAHQMEWVGRMNNIRDRVTEIIHAELIFT